MTGRRPPPQFRPVAVMPSLMRSLFIGVHLFGRRETYLDGSYLTTQYTTIFLLPILPLRRLHVRRLGGGEYEILGEEDADGTDFILPVRWWAIAIAVLVGWQLIADALRRTPAP